MALRDRWTLGLAALLLAPALAGAQNEGQKSPEVQQPAVESFPPVVVATVPRAGEKGVDAAVKEVRITFSEPMLTDRYSAVQVSKELWPELAGKPQFVDGGRTCILPVQLQPGRTYAVWVNQGRFQNFQDESGQPAVPYLLTFATK